MADLSGMKLKKLSKTDWDSYPVGTEFLPPVEPGDYVLRVKGHEFTAKDGYLMDAISFVLESPEDGRNAEVRDWLLTTPRDRGRRKGTCKAGDFLIAVGSEATPGQDQQEWADALEETTEALVTARLDWSCYDGENEKELAKTYTDFPYVRLPDGTYDTTQRQPFIEVVVKAATGTAPAETKRYRANQRVAFYHMRKG